MNAIRKIISNNKLLLLFVFILFIKSICFLWANDSIIWHNTIINDMFYFVFHIILFAGITAPIYFFSQKNAIRYLLVISFIISFVMLANSIYFRAFEDFFSLYTLEQYQNLDNLSSSIFALLKWKDLLYFSDIIIFMIYNKLKKANFNHKANYKIAVMIIFSSTLLSFGADYVHLTFRDQNIFEQTFDPKLTMSKLSLLGYYIEEAISYSSNKLSATLSTKDQKLVQKELDNNLKIYNTNNKAGLLSEKNIIVLQVESLENFVINLKVDGQEVTPFLNSLLNKSIYFNNFYEQINNGGSSDADFLLNTSIYPPRNSSAILSFGENSYFSLPYYLNRSGYKTIAIKQDKPFFYRWKSALKNIGYQDSYSREDFPNPEMLNDNVSDSTMLNTVVNILSKYKEKYFAFISTVSSHVPYEMPDNKRYLSLNKELSNSREGKYFQAIRYTDEQIKHFFEKLRATNQLNNIAIILYGDHTSLNRYFKNEVEEHKDKVYLKYARTKKIPLIIYSDDIQSETVTTISGQIDLMPTIMNLLGLSKQVNTKYVFGRDVFNSLENYALLSDATVIGSKPAKLIPIDILKICDKMIKCNYFKQYTKQP